MTAPTTRTPAQVVAAAVAAIAGRRFCATGENLLQLELATVLGDAGVPFLREVELVGAGRIDFLLAGRVGLEVKVAGSASEVIRQLWRYAHSGELASLVLVTTRATHLRIPRSLCGVPVACVRAEWL